MNPGTEAADDDQRDPPPTMVGQSESESRSETFVTTPGPLVTPSAGSWKIRSTRDGTKSGLGNIGPYALEKELGRGGQAVVYLGEDVRIKRKVALKVLPQFDVQEPAAVARFRREAEAASRLHHPGICGVLEADVRDGVAYIAMPYVLGETLASRITRAKNGFQTLGEFFIGDLSAPRDPTRLQPMVKAAGATPREEISLVAGFIEETARALHAAHEAGVTHRDIKPGNLMITPDHHAVILDFGLAHIEESDSPTLTRSGDLFGTPAYMSPEQVKGNSGLVDRRCDVYALGVVLFEALTLRRPFEAPTRDRLYHAIVETRAPDARSINASIPRDLAVIISTAIEKDRGRRYQTALDFADDLQRMLANEPIRARPTPRIIRMVKWCRRHPGISVAVGGILLTISVALAATFMLLQETRNALRSERESREDSHQALERERNARGDADAVTTFLTDTLSAANPYNSGKDVPISEVLDAAALEVAEQFKTRPLTRARIQQAIGRTYHGLGLHEKAAEILAAAYEARAAHLPANDPQLADSAYDLASLDQARGDFSASRRHLDQALAIVRGQGEEHLLDLAKMLAIDAKLKYTSGDTTGAIEGHREALAIRRKAPGAKKAAIAESLVTLAFSLNERGQNSEAEEAITEAIEIIEDAGGAALRGLPAALNQLAMIQCRAGQLDKALDSIRRSERSAIVVYPPDHPMRADVLWRKGDILLMLRRLDEAEPPLREALEIRRRVLGPSHVDIAVALSTLAGLEKSKGHLDAAEGFYEEARTMRIALLGPESPAVASSEEDLGHVARARKNHAEAEKHFEAALRGFRSTYPGDHHSVAMTLTFLGLGLQDSKKYDAAEDRFRESLAIYGRLNGPEHTTVAQAMNNLGSLLFRAGKAEDAEKMLMDALAMKRRVMPSTNPWFIEGLANLAFVLEARGAYAEAQPFETEALACAKQAYPDGNPEIDAALMRLAPNLAAQKKWTELEEVAREALDRRLRRSAEPWRIAMARCLHGMSLAGLEKVDEAEPELLAAWEVLKDDTPAAPRWRTETLESLIEIARKRGDEAAATSWRAELQRLQAPR